MAAHPAFCNSGQSTGRIQVGYRSRNRDPAVLKPRSKLSSASRRLVIEVLAPRSVRGRIRLGNHTFPCALGRSALTTRKQEGDGATPMGVFRLLCVLYRSDRIARPITALPAEPIRPDDGWCDAPEDRNYNRPVRLPYAASTETLFRTDRVYDIIVCLEHNVTPRKRNAGSAIFFHLARPGYTPTEGCIAVSEPHMRRILAAAAPGAAMIVGRRLAI